MAAALAVPGEQPVEPLALAGVELGRGRGAGAAAAEVDRDQSPPPSSSTAGGPNQSSQVAGLTGGLSSTKSP